MTSDVQQHDLAEEALLTIDPREIVRALNRRKWLIIACALLAGTIATVIALRQPKIYQSVARVIITPVQPNVLGDKLDQSSFYDQAQMEFYFNNTEYLIIESRDVLLRAAALSGLADDPQFVEDYKLGSIKSKDRMARAMERIFRGALTVSPEKDSRVVDLVVEDLNHVRAAKIANAIADAYIDYSLEQRLAATRNASGWLDQRVHEFASQLESDEKALNDFKQRHNLVSISLEDRQNIATTNLATYSSKLIEVESQLMGLESEKTLLQRVAKTGDIESAPRIAKNGVITGIKSQLAELEGKRAEESIRYGEKHPTIVAVDTRIKETQERLKRELQLVIASVEKEIEQAEDTRDSVSAALDAEKEKAMELNALALDYAKISRELGTTRQTYQALLKRRTEADLSGLLKTNFVRSLETAEPRSGPVRPDVRTYALLGALLGLMLGASLAVGTMLLDTTVHTQSEIEEYLRLPFLGIVPSIKNEDDISAEGTPGTRDLYIASNSKSSAAECARSIRTNLLFLGTERDLKEILLTSAGPSEGKTTTAITLGITMAQAGNRVLLVDTDLRRPRLHRTFGVSGETGLTSALLGEISPQEIIKSTEVVGLDVIPCGPLPPNPAELLHTQKFRSIIDELAKSYDRILFDSPPVNAVTDAAILAQQVDGTILVVKSSKTTKDAVRRAKRQLLDVNAPILGVVLNDVDFTEGGYYSGYHQYYYHRYAYTSDADKGAEASS